MALPRYDAHPSDITDYPADWQTPSGVTITAVSSTIAPAGPTAVGSFTGLRSITRVQTVTAGVLYQVEELVTFSNGEKRVSEFEVFGLNN